MIKPILYERIEQKNEIEKAIFSKLTPEERKKAKKFWTALFSKIRHAKKRNLL